MNIVLVNDGTAGDMHPFFAIGRELARRGHDIVVCTNDVYRAPVERLGFRFVSTGTEQEYEENTDLIRGIIAEGCEKAREVAGQTLDEVRQAIGMNYR